MKKMIMIALSILAALAIKKATAIDNHTLEKSHAPKAVTATPLNRSCGNNHKSHPGAP